MSPTSMHKLLREDHKLEKRLRRQVGQAIGDFAMIQDGDKVMVCLSGGKDSYGLLDILLRLRASAPVTFELHAVHLDQKQPGYDADVLPRWLGDHGIEQDTYSVVQRVVPEGKTMCGLCSRLRRGALYNHAERHGFTKIALGHHRDDLVETLFLNLFFHARLAAMAPKLLSDDGRHVVIRPLAYCAERDLAAYAQLRGFPVMPCNLCGSQDNLQRQAVKSMLQDWQRRFPGRIENLARALGDIRPAQLADRSLFDFQSLGREIDRASQDANTWLAEPANS
jgi:tRNA 2-thiocytidine biosynthesis protein TtcA